MAWTTPTLLAPWVFPTLAPAMAAQLTLIQWHLAQELLDILAIP